MIARLVYTNGDTELLTADKFSIIDNRFRSHDPTARVAYYNTRDNYWVRDRPIKDGEGVALLSIHLEY